MTTPLRGIAWIVICALVLIAGMARGDGKIYGLEKVAPTIPYQRALIVFDQGKETLVLQSKYSLPESGAGGVGATVPTSASATLGWVVPVPAIPEIGSMSAEAASDIFMDLGFCTRRSRTSVVGDGAFLGMLFSLPVFLVGSLLWFLSAAKLLPDRWCRHGGIFARASVYSFVVSVFATIAFPNFLESSSAGVDVIREERVGTYDVKVVQSEDSTKLIEWLNERSFAFGDDDRAAFDGYVRDGWCFVVARVNPHLVAATDGIWKDTLARSGREVSEGLAAPLILHFTHDKPVYPLALAATGGHDTEVLIYLISRTKMACGGRLPLCFAGPWDRRYWVVSAEEVLPLQFPEDSGDSLHQVTKSGGVTEKSSLYLTNFRGTLTPEQMREDMTFTPAADNQPFREHIVRW